MDSGLKTCNDNNHLLGCFDIHGDEGKKTEDKVFRAIITSFDMVQCDLCHRSKSCIIYKQEE